ncbi:hypothetical protein ABZT34_10760 [Streptomyces sp. NPDC005329]|uniref:PspA-associated protein PspAB n=1 Tax=Streptomyces sp. NPDC005329 TaxID=3157034 RepID=UPI0033B0EA6F
MGLLEILLGRTKPVVPDLDQLFALPSAAVTLEAAAGFTPTGQGAVCFATVEGSAFEQTHREVQALLDADTERTGPPVRLVRDDYGYSWLVSQRAPDQLPLLVNDLHAVNSAMEVNGFGPQLLCSLAGFEEQRGAAREADGRRLALVYLYKRGSFYPLCTRSDQHKRDNALELQVAALLADDLRIEKDTSRWFPLWDAPGLSG